MPPVLFQISKHSRDHSREVYEQIIIPMYQAMDPAPKVALTQFDSGTHGYMSGGEDEGDALDYGIGPAVFLKWDDAIKSGWFLSEEEKPSCCNSTGVPLVSGGASFISLRTARG